MSKLPLAALATALLTAAPAVADTVSVDGHDVWYEVRGTLSADDPPILLLHGGMMSADLTWGKLLPDLSRGRAVILVEQQGHGHTPDHDGPTTLAGMRADTLGVLDALHVQRAHVVGFSMGGMLGLELAVNAPERVATLTAISASQNGDGMLPEIVQMNRDPSHVPSPEVMALLPTEADMKAMQAGMAGNPSGPQVFGVTMGKLGALLTGPWGWTDAQLAGIKPPVQLLIGDRDFIRPDHAMHMAATIPDAWLGILPDSTHLTILADPALPGMIRHRIEAQ